MVRDITYTGGSSAAGKGGRERDSGLERVGIADCYQDPKEPIIGAWNPGIILPCIPCPISPTISTYRGNHILISFIVFDIFNRFGVKPIKF
jgi:hypothetical protein